MGRRTAEQELSGLRCAGIWCIIIGIMTLPLLSMALPAIITGSIIVCAAGSEVKQVQKHVCCAKGCAITGLVFAILAVFGSIGVGAWLLGPLHNACADEARVVAGIYAASHVIANPRANTYYHPSCGLRSQRRLEAALTTHGINADSRKSGWLPRDALAGAS